MDNKTIELINRFERLLNRLEQGCVIPFVGAGISDKAKIKNDTDFSPKVSAMKNNLATKLNSMPGNSNLVNSLIQNHNYEINDIAKGCKRKTEDNCRKIGKHIENTGYISMDRLAEIHEWLLGEEKTCDVIDIEKFAFLDPRAAHQYLAYLARDGLITEIISTNYDCCIERAFKKSFLFDDANNHPIAVIRDLLEYRKYGGKLKTPDSPRKSILHLYKINGCASNDSSSASRIILTERQLQNFRDEKWVEDMLKDRARRRNLLFCGFGSEEPQVRHTALGISKEFQTTAEQFDNTDDISKLPNAPFLSAHSQPTFAQLQIMVSFVRAHMDEKYKTLDETEKIDAWLKNVFSGSEAEKLEEGETNLTADLFFKRLYQAAFGRLIVRHTRSDSLFYHWLSNHTPHPGLWCSYLKQELYPDIDRKNESGSNLPDISYFGKWPCLLEPSGEGVLILWTWLWTMKYPEKRLPDNSFWYLPLSEDPLFILTALLLLTALVFKKYKSKCYDKPPTKPELPIESVSNIGIKVEIDGNNRKQPFTVYLVHRMVKNQIYFKNIGDKKSRLILKISIPGTYHRRKKERFIIRETINNNANNGEKVSDTNLLVGSQYFINAEDLIRRAVRPENLADYLRKEFFRSDSGNTRVRLEPVD